MSDIGTTTPTNDGGGQAGAIAPSTGMTTTTAPVTAPDTAPVTTTPTAADVFAEPDAAQAVFDRGYVERLRREGARYRTEHQSAAEALGNYERVFGTYDAADRQVWMDLASTWATDPNEAARVMNQIAQAVLTPAEAATATPPAEAGTEPDGGLGDLTPDKVQEMIANALTEQQQAAKEQHAVEEVYSEIRAAGYDPSTMEGFMVLWLANNGGNGDIQAGIKEMQGYRQKVIDEYVAGRSNGHHPTPTPANGAVATAQEPVHDLKDARKAAEAFIRAQHGAGPG